MATLSPQSFHSTIGLPRILSMSQPAASERFVLWIDSVGGFLVCPTTEVKIGQAVPGTRVDVPILGDLSRLHATIERDAEGYVMRAHRETYIDDRYAHGAQPLGDAKQLVLGKMHGGVKLAFRRPHALSMTARLDLVGRNRIDPPVDGVLLMADTCILGPKSNAHVVCPDWPADVVLIRRGDKMYCQATMPLKVDGQQTTGKEKRGQTEISRDSRVEGSELAFSLEAV